MEIGNENARKRGGHGYRTGRPSGREDVIEKPATSLA